MIAHLRGRLLIKHPNQAIIECAGVGYDVTVSVATFTALPDEGGEVSLNIYTRVAEDQLALYGFAGAQEKRLFEKLLSITGIGPKLAITVLSGIAHERLIEAIRSSDHATLTKIPGIGKKTAERVVLELKDKLDNLAVSPAATDAANSTIFAAEDALSALINLGYTRLAAEKAIAAAITRNPALADDFEPLFRSAMSNIR